MAYDPKCSDLAEIFLSDEQNIPEDRKEEMLKLLSQEIQDTIETFIFQTMPHLLAVPKGK